MDLYALPTHLYPQASATGCALLGFYPELQIHFLSTLIYKFS